MILWAILIPIVLLFFKYYVPILLVSFKDGAQFIEEHNNMFKNEFIPELLTFPVDIFMIALGVNLASAFTSRPAREYFETQEAYIAALSNAMTQQTFVLTFFIIGGSFFIATILASRYVKKTYKKATNKMEWLPFLIILYITSIAALIITLVFGA